MASSSAGSSQGVLGSSQRVPDLGEICQYLSLSQNITDEYLQLVKLQIVDLPTAWIDPFKTPLQEPCRRRQLEIVKKLLLDEMTSRGQMKNDKYCQSLALDIAAANGNLETVRKLCKPSLDLLGRNNTHRHGLAIPVLRASNAGHGEVTRYLYDNHYKETLHGLDAICLLLDAIFYGFLDIASDIYDRVLPTVAVTKHERQRSTPLRFLALKPDLFRSHCDLGFWRGLIYSCIHWDFQTDYKTSRPSLFWKTLLGFLKWFGTNKANIRAKKKHCKAHRLLQKMCNAIRDMDKDTSWKETVYEALLEAVESGNKEFFFEIITCNSQLLWISEATSDRNLFQLAVKFKKEKIFNLIHGLGDIKVTLLRSYDNENNNILHIAAHLSSPDQLSKISGAALKMQREIQWFEEVKSLVSEREVVQENNDNKTPRQIFEDFHEPLRKEGEEWMKYTATACSFVAALIATVTFQAIFTVPGGTDETSGKPLLLHDFHFTAFIIADTLAFFASCISVLIFLSILTSRYSFDDFIVSLPRKMILGQSILFISIASMLVAFITSLSASMRQRPLLVVPMKPLASVPAFIFLMLQYPLLKEMISSTYGKRLFHRDTKSWL